jgi:branched chain amino acid efflux pump
MTATTASTDSPVGHGHDSNTSATSLAWRDVLPLAIAVFQFAVAIGATIASSDVDPVAALAGTAVLSAGAAQLTAIELLDDGASVAVAAGTAILINARFVLYGAGFARWFASEPRWKRFTMVFPIVDQSFVLSERRFTDRDDPSWRTRYYVVVCSALFGAFLAGQIVGYLVGDLIPDAGGLHLAGPLVFAGLLAIALTSRTMTGCAIVAATTIALTTGLPGGSGLPLAACAGMAVGVVATRRTTSEEAASR